MACYARSRLSEIGVLLLKSAMSLLSILRSFVSAAVLGAAVGLSAPVLAQDAAELTVRTSRLENQLRQLSGQIEQLQFENRKLTEQLRKFQEDVDFRLNEKSGARPAPAQPAGAQRPGQKRGDAFDPNAQPGAAGAPRTLGTVAQPPGIAAIIDDGQVPGGPLDLNTVGRPVPGAPPAAGPRSGPSVAAATGGTPKEAYNAAIAALQGKQFEQAEMGFRQFLQAHPRDPRVADATYWLGETYLQRQRYRESAEQFLKVSRDYAKAPKAPDSLLKLGISLNGLGAKDQACATYAKVGVDYPEASSNVRQGVEREQRRARCS
jgi:tol-pal system protein YbgF